MDISDAYRRARRTTSALCAIALAWSAAQLDVKSLNVGPAGTVDLSNASVPLILACGVIYTVARCTIEFAMQSADVRRWNLARLDFKITLFLVRATILMLAAAGIYRAVETVAYVAAGVLVIVFASMTLFVAGIFIITPILVRRNPPKGSPIWRVVEAESLSVLIVMALLAVALVALGIASLRYEPLRSLWTVPPTPTAITIFLVAAIGVILSVCAELFLGRRLFGDEL